MQTWTINPSKASQQNRILKDSFESAAWRVQDVVCGVDEVGRGCLAGPLVAAAVILHPGKKSRIIKDSKLLTQPELLKGYDWIIKNSWHAYAIISPNQIDTHNIYQANLKVMKRAVVQALITSSIRPSAILVDAMPLSLQHTEYHDIPIHAAPKGERWSSSIAAASIYAKVTRDALIRKLEPIFPGYKLADHKGYSVKAHCIAIREQGHTIIHRTSFLDKIINYEESNEGNQSSLC